MDFTHLPKFIITSSQSEEYGDWVKKVSALVKKPYLHIHNMFTSERWTLDEIRSSYLNATKHNGNVSQSIAWWANRKRRNSKMFIFCTGCNKDVLARITDGREIYPHREDLFNLPFWKCDTCKNYVGCHYKTTTPTKPLGVIATKDILNARKHIHDLLDPIWQDKKIGRKKLYSLLEIKLGYTYHTGDIRDIEEARRIYKIIREIKQTVEK